jgi:hypothetical protein
VVGFNSPGSLAAIETEIAEYADEMPPAGQPALERLRGRTTASTRTSWNMLFNTDT